MIQSHPSHEEQCCDGHDQGAPKSYDFIRLILSIIVVVVSLYFLRYFIIAQMSERKTTYESYQLWSDADRISAKISAVKTLRNP